LKLFRATLTEEKIISDKEFARIEEEVKAEVEKAVRFAEESPEPDPSELYTNIYADEQ
jgi:pyruvate dehydrogenase E1 component alpha subunit